MPLVQGQSEKHLSVASVQFHQAPLKWLTCQRTEWASWREGIFIIFTVHFPHNCPPSSKLTATLSATQRNALGNSPERSVGMVSDYLQKTAHPKEPCLVYEGVSKGSFSTDATLPVLCHLYWEKTQICNRCGESLSAHRWERNGSKEKNPNYLMM